MFIFDLIGFLFAGWLKIVFFLILILVIPALLFGGIIDLFNNGFRWWREKLTGKSPPQIQEPPTEPSLPYRDSDRAATPEQIDKLIDSTYAKYQLSILKEYADVLRSAMKSTKYVLRDHMRTEEYVARIFRDISSAITLHLGKSFVSPLTTDLGSLCIRDGKFVGYQALDTPYPVAYTLIEKGFRPNTTLRDLLPNFKDSSLVSDFESACERIQRTPIPLQYPTGKRLEHTWICGTTGSGKSTLLKRLILHDLQAENPPALVIVDSHNELIPYISHLDLFHPEHGKLKDRLIIFTPSQPPPAINVFHSYGPADEATTEDAITILRYLFQSLDVNLTGKQGILFEGCTRLLLTFPQLISRDANLRDFVLLLRNSAQFIEVARLLPKGHQSREFVEEELSNDTYRETKNELLYRLQGIRGKGYVGRMVSAEQTGVDLYSRLNNGAIVLIDAAGLSDSGSLYGRVCIALVLRAVFARYPIPEAKRKETFLFVDEAQEYFDDNTRKLLVGARKFKLGGVFAHQQLKDCEEGLRAYLTGQTSIRMIGRPHEDDMNAIARYLHCDSEFLHQPEHHFSIWIRGVTDKAVSASVDAKALDQPEMDEDAYARLLKENRKRITIVEAPRQEPEPEAKPKQAPVEDIGIPFLVTGAQKAELRRRGYTEETIRQLRPLEVHRILKKPYTYGSPPEEPIREAAEEPAPYVARTVQPDTSTEAPQVRRKRPKKRRGPPEDIDTSA